MILETSKLIQGSYLMIVGNNQIVRIESINYDDKTLVLCEFPDQIHRVNDPDFVGIKVSDRWLLKLDFESKYFKEDLGDGFDYELKDIRIRNYVKYPDVFNTFINDRLESGFEFVHEIQYYLS